jgi:hypothetical protein
MRSESTCAGKEKTLRREGKFVERVPAQEKKIPLEEGGKCVERVPG